LSDHSPETLERAVKEALDTTVRGATAMGFSWIRLDGVRVLEDAVVVRVVASDDHSEDPRRRRPEREHPARPCPGRLLTRR